jgi:ParB family protein of integrating conjugative element (PFGI_1 class)
MPARHADLTLDAIAQQLLATRNEAPREHDPADPVSDATLRVTLDQLRPYEHNPRFLPNPHHAELKASIRQRGLDQPPVITRRPGDAHYILRNGGNTRLAILNELWQETAEERFFHLDCLYKPWSDEPCALLGHLAENELHGALSFVERALSVGTLKRLFEQDGSPLTQAELAARLRAGGYPVSQSHISRMLETLEHLLPGLPQALRTGLGKPQIERLLGLRRQAQRLCRQRHSDAADEFQAIWTATLQEVDNPGPVEIEAIRTRLLERLSSELQCSPRELADELASGGQPTPPPTDTPPVSAQPLPAPAPTTPLSRVERIRQQIERLTADEPANNPAPEAIWTIAPALDNPTALHWEIQRLGARLATAAHTSSNSLGKAGVTSDGSPEQVLGALFDALLPDLASSAALVRLLLGSQDAGIWQAPLPDRQLLELIRLVRLSRRLIELTDRSHP